MIDASKTADALPAKERRTILVIDDDPAMRTILSLPLTAFGCLVLVAANGEEALDITRHHPEIGVIVLDVMMSGLSGKKLGEQLKAKLPDAFVLYCSGHSAAVMSRHDIDVRIEHFLQKPCGVSELRQKLEELLATP